MGVLADVRDTRVLSLLVSLYQLQSPDLEGRGGGCDDGGGKEGVRVRGGSDSSSGRK